MKEIVLDKGYIAVVDDDDFDRVKHIRWFSRDNGKGYISVEGWEKTAGGRIRVRLGRYILGVTDRYIEVDHKDGDPLNNTRDNIRESSRAENQRNRKKTRGTSKYKGVSWNVADACWKAMICVGGEYIGLGSFDNEHEAAEAYNQAAAKYFKDFASTNDIIVPVLGNSSQRFCTRKTLKRTNFD